MKTSCLISTILLASSVEAFVPPLAALGTRAVKGPAKKVATKKAPVAGTRVIKGAPAKKGAPKKGEDTEKEAVKAPPKKSLFAKKAAPVKKEAAPAKAAPKAAPKKALFAKKAAPVKKVAAAPVKKAGKAAPKKIAVKKVTKSNKPAAKAAPVRAVSRKKPPLSSIRKAADPNDRLVVTDMAGILPPVGLFDPLGLAANASPDLLRKYREAELTHGRIAMIASVGFFVGEAVGGKTPLFAGQASGAGVAQIVQIPPGFWVSLVVATFAIETYRVQLMIEDPVTATPEKFGRYRKDWVAGDLRFDPFGLKPDDPAEFKSKQTKELQNGRLAMLAVSGFLAQELTNNKGIVENILDAIGIDFSTLSLPSLPDLPF